MDNIEKMRRGIIRDMSEGVMAIGFDGRIKFLNNAALDILDRTEEELLDRPFARCFFEYEENDGFNQTVLDAVYDRTGTHRNAVSYFTGEVTKQLNITTSFLREGEDKIGIIAVLSDISELTELRDAVKAMEKIKRLNSQLEMRNKLLGETFGRYLSDEIVRQLLETPDGLVLGGKKQVVTALMSDIRGFTAMCEQMDPRSLVTMLNHYLGEMTEIIEKHGGTVIEFIGDGILVLFGEPVKSRSHAADAVAAAVEMEAAVAEINRWNRERGFPVLEMGIGINTGEAIVGNIGSEKRTKYNVIGSNINLCGRIESYTVGGQILVSPMTMARIDAPVTVVSMQEVFPKGVEKPIVLSHVTAIGEPYNLSCEKEKAELTVLRKPLTVDFHVIKDKHRDENVKHGIIRAISQEEALMETDEAIEQFDNLQFYIMPGESGDVPQKVFAKVMYLKEEGLVLRFTAYPRDFDAWYLQVIKENEG